MGYSLKPGVVTGEDYKTLLKAAKEGGYALPAVNAVGTNSVNAVMEAAAKNRSDVIVQFSNSPLAEYTVLDYRLQCHRQTQHHLLHPLLLRVLSLSSFRWEPFV